MFNLKEVNFEFTIKRQFTLQFITFRSGTKQLKILIKQDRVNDNIICVHYVCS